MKILNTIRNNATYILAFVPIGLFAYSIILHNSQVKIWTDAHDFHQRCDDYQNYYYTIGQNGKLERHSRISSALSREGIKSFS